MGDEKKFEQWLKDNYPNGEYPPHLRTATFAEILTMYRKSKKSKKKKKINWIMVSLVLFWTTFWAMMLALFIHLISR